MNDVGEIQAVKYEAYADNGYVVNEPIVQFGIKMLGNCYNKERWHFKLFNALTDTVKKSWARSPG